MINPMRSADVTVRDVLNGLEAMEKWARQLRDALATLDQEQPLYVKPRLVASAPKISGGQCPPGPRDPKPRPRPKPKKTTKT